jgi:2,4-dienoyl-CoA reductase-like NADH-dependent reductase (Old Yellow Enzyme family)
MPHLFSPFSLRSLTLHNHIVMPPMCMYTAANDGLATDWHLAHYLTRAAGGTGLIIAEATAVEPRGRISQHDLGLWDDAQVEPLGRIVRLVKAEGAAMAVQLAHAGRKAFSRNRGHGPELPVAPSPLPFSDEWRTPHALSQTEIDQVIAAWRAATVRAEAAGFDAVEIHAAHGYLNHQFLSPLANFREDEYAGSLENRMRMLLRVVEAVRQVWPSEQALLVRISTTDWVDGGLTPRDLVMVSRALARQGVDLIHCSAGGITPVGPSSLGPGYLVPFAETIRLEAEIPTAAVGLITTPELANEIIANGRADLVALGRELLRHPHWPLDAARILGHNIDWPRQYRQACSP